MLEGDVGVEDSEGTVIISSIRRGQHFHILRTLLSKTLRRAFTTHQKKALKVGPPAGRAYSLRVHIAGYSCYINKGLQSHRKKAQKVGKQDLRSTRWQAGGRADGWWAS